MGCWGGEDGFAAIGLCSVVDRITCLPDAHEGILRRELILDYLVGPVSSEDRCKREAGAEIGGWYTIGFEGGVWGHEPQNVGGLQKLGKAWNGFSMGPPEGTSLVYTLMF